MGLFGHERRKREEHRGGKEHASKQASGLRDWIGVLPFGGMDGGVHSLWLWFAVAWDVDGGLIDRKSKPRERERRLEMHMENEKCHLVLEQRSFPVFEVRVTCCVWYWPSDQWWDR